METVGEIRKKKRPGVATDDYLYSLTTSPERDVLARAEQLRLPYDLFRLFTQNKVYCGDVLEGIVRLSFGEVPDYASEPFSDPAHPLDGLYRLGALRFGVEVKNARPWLYPEARDIWEMLRKCVLEDAQPLLIARKLHWLTFRVFSAIGAMGFEFHRQVFAEQTALHLRDVQHVDLLGYKDVIARPIAPYPPLVQFLGTTLRAHGPDYARRWASRRTLVEEYAVTKGLDRLPDTDRRELTREFVDEVIPKNERKGWGDHFGL